MFKRIFFSVLLTAVIMSMSYGQVKTALGFYSELKYYPDTSVKILKIDYGIAMKFVMNGMSIYVPFGFQSDSKNTGVGGVHAGLDFTLGKGSFKPLIGYKAYLSKEQYTTMHNFRGGFVWWVNKNVAYQFLFEAPFDMNDFEKYWRGRNFGFSLILAF